VVIFVKSVQRCIAMAQLLVEQNFPAIAIHRGMTQEERLSRYDNAECGCALGRNDFGRFCEKYGPDTNSEAKLNSVTRL
jgi:hypothetical protein